MHIYIYCTWQVLEEIMGESRAHFVPFREYQLRAIVQYVCVWKDRVKSH